MKVFFYSGRKQSGVRGNREAHTASLEQRQHSGFFMPFSRASLKEARLFMQDEGGKARARARKLIVGQNSSKLESNRKGRGNLT